MSGPGGSEFQDLPVPHPLTDVCLPLRPRDNIALGRSSTQGHAAETRPAGVAEARIASIMVQVPPEEPPYQGRSISPL